MEKVYLCGFAVLAVMFFAYCIFQLVKIDQVHREQVNELDRCIVELDKTISNYEEQSVPRE